MSEVVVAPRAGLAEEEDAGTASASAGSASAPRAPGVLSSNQRKRRRMKALTLERKARKLDKQHRREAFKQAADTAADATAAQRPAKRTPAKKPKQMQKQKATSSATSPAAAAARPKAKAAAAAAATAEATAEATAAATAAPALPGQNWKALLAQGAIRPKPEKRNRHEERQRKEREAEQALAQASGAAKAEAEAGEARPALPSIDWTRLFAPAGYAPRMVALDCEMVGVGTKDDSRLARVCVVDEQGRVVMDEYCRPTEKITNYRTQWSGIRAKDLVDAPSFWVVQQRVADVVRGRVMVGHALKNDLEVLSLRHPRSLLRDTSTYMPLRRANVVGRRGTPKLSELALKELGKVIQDGEHDPYVDARAALEVYRVHRSAWERSILERRKQRRQERDKVRGKPGVAEPEPAAAAEEEDDDDEDDDDEEDEEDGEDDEEDCEGDEGGGGDKDEGRRQKEVAEEPEPSVDPFSSRRAHRPNKHKRSKASET